MRERVSAGWIVVAALLSLGLAEGAAAEAGWAVPGSVYVEMGGGVEWVDLPEVSVGISAGESFAGTDDEFDRWTAEVAFGYADPDGLSLPDPIGRNARIEARVRYAEGTSQSDARAGSASVGSITSGAAVLFLGPVDALFNSKLETWDADLTYQTDVAVTDWLSISPLFGLTYTRMRFENDYKFRSIGGPGTFEINDRTRTHYYGGVLGVDFAVRPSEAVELSMGLRGDLMGATASMEARQDAVLPTRQESDNDTNFAGRASATVGATLYLGPLALGVEGFARYLSYLATPDHPTTLSDRASNIDGEDMWSAGARASLTIWFP